MLGCRRVFRCLKAALATWVCSSVPGFTSYTKMDTGLPVAWRGRGSQGPEGCGPPRTHHSSSEMVPRAAQYPKGRAAGRISPQVSL